MRLIPVIGVPPIIIIDFLTRHFRCLNIIQCNDCNRISSSSLLAIESMESMYPAMLAEQLVGLVDVISPVVLAADKTEIFGSGSNEV